MALKEMIESWANDLYITCEDTSKCGQCLREEIKSNICKEFLSYHTGEIATQEIMTIESETKKEFNNTPLYKRVKSLMAEGQDLQKIAKDLSEEGIEI